jgi:hypothetical protein
MNERFEHFEEVHELVELLCERQANETQLARLQELVQSDKAALRFYVDYLDLHAQFLWRSQNLGATCFQSTSSLLSSEELSLSHSKLRRSSRPMAASIAPLTRKFFRASTFGWVATTLALVAVVYWSARHTSSNGLAGPSPTAPAITSIRIPSGLVSFSLDKIGTVVLEGPADFEFLSPMRARLNKGNLKMRVTEDSGHGFVVQTPDGEVTDLGTEFSLNVSDGKRTSLIVHEGEVDLRVGRTRQLNGPERLIEGEAVSFNATG